MNGYLKIPMRSRLRDIDCRRFVLPLLPPQVLFISGSGVEQRVALKTSDRNPKFISIPLEAKLKFEVVYTHDRESYILRLHRRAKSLERQTDGQTDK